MARRNRGLTKQAIQRRWKEGRGQGEGEFYQPWLTIRDVPSRGQSNRPSGWKTKRVHHLLSRNELRYFYLLEWATQVVDIREQYPLWPLEETQRIAAELGFKHPAPPGGNYMIMTSDFLIVLDDGRWVVRTIKEVDGLGDERVAMRILRVECAHASDGAHIVVADLQAESREGGEPIHELCEQKGVSKPATSSAT